MPKVTAEDISRQQVEVSLLSVGLSAIPADSAIGVQQRVLQVAESTFSGSVLEGFKLKSVELTNVGLDEEAESLKPVKGKAGAKLVLEVEVTEAMCNLHSNLHGGCAAFLLDRKLLLQSSSLATCRLHSLQSARHCHLLLSQMKIRGRRLAYRRISTSSFYKQYQLVPSYSMHFHKQCIDPV